MKYEEKYIGSKDELLNFINEFFESLKDGRAYVEEANVEIPENRDIKFKVFYENNEVKGQYSIKASWSNKEIIEEDFLF